MGTFELGVLTGFLANLAFLALLRLLPATLVRYSASIGQPYVEQEMNMRSWYAPIRIGSPTSLWRMLLGPLTEYLEIHLSLDEGQWTSVDLDGFGNPRPFRIDGATTIPALTLLAQNHNVFVLGDIDDAHRIPEGSHVMRVRILRSLDKSVAAEAGFNLTIERGEVTLDNNLLGSVSA